mmetsp:Transcript_6926/g.16810  ORF Transcript_6926/g.16810 Transcript_6926/m.16810 type:complete len:210 (+) Transcript_6926:713-1342(+)
MQYACRYVCVGRSVTGSLGKRESLPEVDLHGAGQLRHLREPAMIQLLTHVVQHFDPGLLRFLVEAANHGVGARPASTARAALSWQLEDARHVAHIGRGLLVLAAAEHDHLCERVLGALSVELGLLRFAVVATVGSAGSFLRLSSLEVPVFLVDLEAHRSTLHQQILEVLGVPFGVEYHLGDPLPPVLAVLLSRLEEVWEVACGPAVAAV